MRVPKSWKEINVIQFQELLPVYQKTLTEADNEKYNDLWIEIIAIASDKLFDEVAALPINTYYVKKNWFRKKKVTGIKEYIKDLSFLHDTSFKQKPKFELELNGITYKAVKEAKEFNAARCIEYKTFMAKGGLIKNLHLFLATIYHPFDSEGKVIEQNHAVRAEVFSKANIELVYPTVFFYTKVWKSSIKRIQEYGIRVAREKNQEAEELLMLTLKEVLENIGDGTLPSTKSQEVILSKKMS